jgi:hypothetical protein
LAQRFTTGKNVFSVVKIGDLENRLAQKNGETLSTMKTINRLALGSISSLLLSAGMVRAAQHLDPLSNSAACTDCDSAASAMPAMSCTTPCMHRVD